MKNAKFLLAVPALVALFTFSGCQFVFKGKGALSACSGIKGCATEAPITNDPQPQPEPEPLGCAGGYDDGQEFTRTRYLSSVAIIGKETCQSEEQNCSCSNGGITCDGTYAAESCSATVTSITGGDILVLRERITGQTAPSFSDGSLIAFSSAGEYKGIAVVRDTAQEILRYPSGLKLEMNPSETTQYLLTFGTVNSDLGSEVHIFPNSIAPNASTVLGAPTRVQNTDAVPNYFFSFGYSAQSAAGRRYISDKDEDGYPRVNFYSNGATRDSCSVNYGAGYAGWSVVGLFNYMFNFGDALWIARTDGSGGNWAIDQASHCEEGASSLFDPIIFGGGVDQNPKICDLFEFRDNAGTWNNNLFVTRGDIMAAGPRVYRYHYDAGEDQWIEDASPFVNRAIAAYYHHRGPFSNKQIYTYETDGANRYLRRYNASGALQATLFTDTDGSVLNEVDASYCAWMVQIPSP